MHKDWYQLNQRLLKRLKWERGFMTMLQADGSGGSIEPPNLFPHWRFVHP